jgi:hypothetical protein
MAYATVADLKTIQRWPTIAGLLADGRPGGVQPTEAELDDHPTLLALLDRAAGEINAALRVGKRYTVDQLESLTGDSREYLAGLNCDLAWGYLLRRGPVPAAAEAWLKRPLEQLELLRTGANVFDLEEIADAGLPDGSLPSVQQIVNSNDLSQRTPNYFGSAIRRLPLDRR